jgi:hypothetical protein
VRGLLTKKREEKSHLLTCRRLVNICESEIVNTSKWLPEKRALNPLLGALLFVTTSEKENGFLLIETFRKLFHPQNYGHQGSILGGRLLFIRGSNNFSFLSKTYLWINTRGILRRECLWLGMADVCYKSSHIV